MPRRSEDDLGVTITAESNGHDPDAVLDMDDLFSQEINYKEYEEIEKALQTPAGHYVTAPPFAYKAQAVEVKVYVEEDGVEMQRTIRRPVYRFWDKLTNMDDGNEQYLGIAISPMAVYSAGAGEERKQYLTQVNGAKPDFPSQFWTQAIKLYKASQGERPKSIGEVVSFLADNQLILTNREGKKRDDEEVARTFVVGFKLAQ